jgi:hypothetical protein
MEASQLHVHGASTVELQQKALAALHTQVEASYQEFESDPFVVVAKLNSLFTKKSLQDMHEPRLSSSMPVLCERGHYLPKGVLIIYLPNPNPLLRG